MADVWWFALGGCLSCCAAIHGVRLEHAQYGERNIIVDRTENHGSEWFHLPEPFFQPGDPQPYPPTRDYRSSMTRDNSSIMVLIAALDERQTVATLRDIFERAKAPSRVYVGVVQQNGADTEDALDGLCRVLGSPLVLKEEFQGRELHKRQEEDDVWGQSRYTLESFARCGPAGHVRIHRMDRLEAKGPAYARGRQPILLSEGGAMEDFCLQIDAHSVFAQDWDDSLISQWAATENEYAILTTYPHNANEFKEDRKPPNMGGNWEMPSLCRASFVGRGIVRNLIASAVQGLDKPILSKFWAAGQSFSRCHAERDVPNDHHSQHIFLGEEFSRAARLWTNGYDFYTPSRPALGTWYGQDIKHRGFWARNTSEQKYGEERMRTLLHSPESNQTDAARAALRGFDLGTRRSLEAYSKLTGMNTLTNKGHDTQCAVTKWTPWNSDAQQPYQILNQSPALLGVGFLDDVTRKSVQARKLRRSRGKLSEQPSL